MSFFLQGATVTLGGHDMVSMDEQNDSISEKEEESDLSDSEEEEDR